MQKWKFGGGGGSDGRWKSMMDGLTTTMMVA